MDTTQLTQLVALFPQLSLLIIVGFGYRWLYTQHRAERAERDADWRKFLSDQQHGFTSSIEGMVVEFRTLIARERDEYIGELRRVTDAVTALDHHALETDRRHVAELKLAQLDATLIQLRERLAQKNELVKSLTRLRGMADPEAGRVSRPSDEEA
jgi:hypothetical protein